MGEEQIAEGTVLGGSYRIERVLGRGGMATVFEASHVRLPRRVAIKVIKADGDHGQEFLVRFRREAETLAKLEHPNIVSVVDWNVTDAGLPYLVMELLHGEDLSQLLRREGALPLSLAIHLFAQVAAALEVAHSHGIVHRDIKPSNVFLCKSGPVDHFVKVLDFGIAKHVLSTASLLTHDRSLLGTPAYMSPEQARGENHIVDERSDQFALALILYEMLTGKPAFYRHGEPAFATLFRVISEQPAPLTDTQLDQVILRALRKRPEDRYPALADFVAAVVGCCKQSLELPILPQKTIRTAAFHAVLTDPSISTEPVLSSHNTRRSGELLPKGSAGQGGLGLRLLTGLGSVTILMVNGSFRVIEPYTLQAVAATSGTSSTPPDQVASPSPLAPHDRALSLGKEEAASPSVSAPIPEQKDVPLALVRRDSAGSQEPAPNPTKTSSKPVTVHRDPVRFEMMVGFPKRSIGEQYVLGCLQRERRIAWAQYRSKILRFEGAKQLRVKSDLATGPKAAIEECLSGIVLEVMMVPSVIEVRVR